MPEQREKCWEVNALGKRCQSWGVEADGRCGMHHRKAKKAEAASLEPKPGGAPRAHLAHVATKHAGLIEATLLAALQAETTRHVKCQFCKRANSFVLPDHGARVKAVQTLLEEGYGRPQLAESPKTDVEGVLGLEDMSDEELLQIKRRLQELAEPEAPTAA